jgi:hypothetical protein
MWVQPVGSTMDVGDVAMKSSPGIQENQNVPIVVVPASVRLRLYWKLFGPSWLFAIVAVALSAMTSLLRGQSL